MAAAPKLQELLRSRTTRLLSFWAVDTVQTDYDRSLSNKARTVSPSVMPTTRPVISGRVPDSTAEMKTRMESQCMIDDLVGGIINDGLSIPIPTVHDAILTTPPHVEHIKQRIKNSFLQRCGLDVGLGVTGGDSSLAA